MFEEIVVKNPFRDRKFGWGWSCSPTGRDAYSIEIPRRPSETGTINQINQAIESDRTFRSIKSSGTFYSTAWFYDGRRITATWHFGLLKTVDDLPYNGPDDDDDFNYPQWSMANSRHHLDNDVYGYTWFSGLDLDSELWENGELKIKVDTEDKPDDLITQAAAAKIYGELTRNKPTVQAINQAIQKRQLIGYKNPDAKHKRQAATLVSEAAVHKLWG